MRAWLSAALPRGSTIPVPLGKTIRLFLHWCQPEDGGRVTDLDLSVAFYDAAWKYVGVCSYYELKLLAPAPAHEGDEGDEGEEEGPGEGDLAAERDHGRDGAGREEQAKENDERAAVDDALHEGSGESR